MKQSPCLFLYGMVRYIQIVINTRSMIILLLLFFFSMVQMSVILGGDDYDTEGLVIKNDVNSNAKELTKNKILTSYNNKEKNTDSFSEDSGEDNDTNEFNLSVNQIELRKLNKKLKKIEEEEKEETIKKGIDKHDDIKGPSPFPNQYKNKSDNELLINNFITIKNSEKLINPEPGPDEKPDNNPDVKPNDESDSSSDKGPIENQPESRFKKKYFGIPIILFSLYGIYKYIPLKKLVFLQNFINATKSKFWSMFDTYYKRTTKSKLIDQIDFSPAQDEVNNNDDREEIIEQEETEQEKIESHNDYSEKSENQKIPTDNFQPVERRPENLEMLGGKQQRPFGSMRLFGSSFSATFLLLFAGYLLKEPNKELKKIEETPYDTYRIYLRYAVAGVAFAVSAVIVFGMAQTT